MIRLKSFTGLFFFFLIFCAATLFPRETETVIRRGYRGIALGMSREEVENLLKKDSWFDYRGEASLSLLKRPRASLIDAGGSLFISRGLFQFEENELSAIILELNPETVDWYTVYTDLEEKYGPPVDLNPTLARWDDGLTLLILERPLTVKYLDADVFRLAAEEERDRAAWREKARRDFLSEF